MGWITCARCDERFALSDETENTMRRSAATFHCPWGHPQHFPLGKSEAQRLREQLDAQRRRAEQAEQQNSRIREERDAAERSASAFKGQATRLRNRAKAGVCPCCNRTVNQLARHMAEKHPDFEPEAKEPA